MSDKRTGFCNHAGQERKRQGLRWRQLALLSTFAIGIVGVGIAIGQAAPGTVYDPMAPGSGCAWGQLKGNLPSAPTLVLAFDKDLNVQGFHRPGAGPADVPKESPEERASGITLDVLVSHHNPTCYTIGGQERCVQD